MSAAVNNVLRNGDVSLAIEVPDSANISVFRQLNDKWDVMADVQYTGWSSIQELRVVRSTGVSLPPTPAGVADPLGSTI